jgi:tyrosine-protein phosphatase SIW14
VPGMENFARLAPGVYRSAPPRPEAWPVLQGMGFRTVVGLAPPRSDSTAARRAGIEVVDLALRTGATGRSVPSEEEIRAFFGIVLDLARRPILFQGEEGPEGASTMTALYRIEIDGWTPDEAMEEVRAFGGPGFHRAQTDFVKSYVPRGYGTKR